MDRSLGRTLATGLVVVAVLSAAAIVVLFVFPGAVGAEASYVVLSDSMSPTINAGDVVVVRSVDPQSIERGDVITYRSDGSGGRERITHRVVGIETTDEGRQFTTKGDANEEPDREPVGETEVIGRVWFTIPLVGHFLLFAGTDAGILSLVVVPAVLLVASEVYALYVGASGDERGGDGR